MGGRWAQLTVDAHIAHALDYTKPVSPVAEQAVFNALELRRLIAKLGCYPLISEDGNRVFVTQPSGEAIFNILLPTSDRVEPPDRKHDTLAAIARLNAYKQEHGLV